MKTVSERDVKRLHAAEGWLELGNFTEANEELEKIALTLRAHPDVLEVRYNVYALAKNWEGCLAIAETLTGQMPGRVFGWLALASA